MSEEREPRDRALEDIKAGLKLIPSDRPVALILRHGDREVFELRDLIDSIPITEKGVERSKQVGAILEGRIRQLHSSPLERCIQTAKAIQEGGGATGAIELSTNLGAPGCFVSQGDKAGDSFEELGLEGVFEAQLASGSPPPGFRRTLEGTRRLMGEVLSSGRTPGVHVWITHDSILGVCLGQLLGWRDTSHFPSYLEGAWFWVEDHRLKVVYRGVVWS